MMRKANITKSILSIASPGTNLVPGDNKLARNLARRCNEYAADLKRRHPERFGFWASLPLPDIEGSLGELEYALDTLNADGVVLQTNSHGIYLGNRNLEPLFGELNRRSSVVFIHPSEPCCSHSDGLTSSCNPLTSFPSPMMEYFFDTARSVIDMFISETIEKSPRVTFILSHAGGEIPSLVDRFARFATIILKHPLTTERIKTAFIHQFYFYLAGFVFPDQIQGLLPYVDASRLLYGSDYPFTPEPVVHHLADTMDPEIKKLFSAEVAQSAIYQWNASKILDRTHRP